MALTTNLQAYWKFDESSGNASDSSGNSNTLVNNGTVTFPAGKINNGSRTAGSGFKYWSIADASQTGLDLLGDCTFNFWLNLDTYPDPASESVVFYKNAAAPQGGYFFRINNDGTVTFRLSSDGTNAQNANVSWTPSASTWYMTTCVYDTGGNFKLYVNSVQQGATQTGLFTSINNSSAPFWLGTRIVNDTSVFLNGILDEFGIWSRALTGAEITQLYNGGVGLQYPFATSAATQNNLALLGVGS